MAADLPADPDTAPFLAALQDGRIELQRCTACGRHRFPPMPACPWCGGDDATTGPVSGAGEVYSWVVVHRALTPASADEVPYAVATVTLTEGCRMFGRVEAADGGLPGDLRAGLPVTARVHHHDGRIEVRFVPERTGP